MTGRRGSRAGSVWDGESPVHPNHPSGETPEPEIEHPHPSSSLLEALRAKPSVVYAKPPFAGPEAVLRYLARYTHRVALSNARLISLTDDHVVFRYRDRRCKGHWRTMRLHAVELLRRFLQHVLPYRFVRIRYFGWMANRHRQEHLERIRRLLRAEREQLAVVEGSDDSRQAEDRSDRNAPDREATEIPDLLCPYCRGALVLMVALPLPPPYVTACCPP